MPCPNCGAPLYYRNSSPTYDPKNPYDYDYAECLGRIEREGWSTTKSGERKWRVKYTTEPCDWKDGLQAKVRTMSFQERADAINEERSETPVPEQRHTEPVTTGRLVLNDYR